MTKDDPSVRHDVAGLTLQWELEKGTLTANGTSTTLMARDEVLAPLLRSYHAMIGSERLSLALQLEGAKSVTADWAFITAHPTFEAGFAAFSDHLAALGWGRWRISLLDMEAKRLHVEMHECWEGQVQRSLGIDWGAGIVSGRIAAIGSHLFHTICQATPIKAMVRGDAFDVYEVLPLDLSLLQAPEQPAEGAANQTAQGELTNVLRHLTDTADERVKALAEREAMLAELREQIEFNRRQQEAMHAMSTPIIQVWDGVLVAPVMGIVDGVRTNDLMEKMLEELVRTKSRVAILDLTGVEVIDTQTAEAFLKVIGGAQLLGANGFISGINPQVAQTIVALGVDLGRIAVFANLKDALQAAIRGMGRKGTGLSA